MRKHIKTYIHIVSFFVLVALLPSYSAYAVNFDSFFQKAASHLVSFDYEYEMQSEILIKGSGNVAVQDSAFILNGPGLELRCDGKTRWTVDHAGAEVYIEPAFKGDNVFNDNPALLVSTASKHFNVVSNEEVTQASVSKILSDKSISTKVKKRITSLVILKPKLNKGLSRLELYFDKEGIPVIAISVNNEDVETVLLISNFRFRNKKPMSFFQMDIGKLDSSYYITDFRL